MGILGRRNPIFANTPPKHFRNEKHLVWDTSRKWHIYDQYYITEPFKYWNPNNKSRII